jgi:hypothetical protein
LCFELKIITRAKSPENNRRVGTKTDFYLLEKHSEE